MIWPAGELPQKLFCKFPDVRVRPDLGVVRGSQARLIRPRPSALRCRWRGCTPCWHDRPPALQCRMTDRPTVCTYYLRLPPDELSPRPQPAGAGRLALPHVAAAVASSVGHARAATGDRYKNCAHSPAAWLAPLPLFSALSHAVQR